MPRRPLILLLALLTGCASVTPEFDHHFGDAVREARRLQIRDPLAGQRPDDATGLDGAAARAALHRYQDSFREPPPVANVINIGGLARGQ